MPDTYFSSLSDSGKPPHFKYFNGEEWKDSLSGKMIEIRSPIDNDCLGSIPVVTHAEIDQVIDSARKAQRQWAKVPMIERKKILQLAADWIRHHESVLTDLLIKEIGKPFIEAKDEIERSADMIDYFANEALNLRGEELSGEAFPGYDQTKMAVIERVPLGVVVAIGPFNYPVNLSISKIVPALVTGNAVIFKPPTQGTLSGLYLTEVFRMAGLPKGLLSTVTGEGIDVGDYLVTHRSVDMVAFTGSSPVGQSLAAKIGMIPILFECGGNNPAIVLPDADLDTTAIEIVKGAFAYAGQRCTAIKYVLGLKPTLDALLPLVVSKTRETVRIGNPREKETTIGPLISDKAVDEMEKRIISAKSQGAKVVSGGKRNGRMMEPTILNDVRPSMEIMHTETFGPVVSFLAVRSMDEALKIINESQYGLQASIFTADEGAAIKLAQQVEVGSVQINSKPQRGPDHFPFLGIKKSGLGIQGIRYTLEAMTRLKPVILSKPH